MGHAAQATTAGGVLSFLQPPAAGLRQQSQHREKVFRPIPSQNLGMLAATNLNQSNLSCSRKDMTATARHKVIWKVQAKNTLSRCMSEGRSLVVSNWQACPIRQLSHAASCTSIAVSSSLALPPPKMHAQGMRRWILTGFHEHDAEPENQSPMIVQTSWNQASWA